MREDGEQRHAKFGSRDAILEPLGDFVDPTNFTPRLLALLSNALVWRESHELRKAFGLGTSEWRVISALATRPGWSATDVSAFLGMNKALISKSVNTLVERDLVVRLDGPRGLRRLYLTPDGADMHHAMRPISMRGEEIIHAGLSPAEIDQLNMLLRRLLERLPELQSTREDTADPGPGDDLQDRFLAS